MQRFKKKIVGLPVIGYSLRIISNIKNLPKHHDKLMSLSYDLSNKERELAKLTDTYELLEDRFNALQLKRDTVQSQMNLIEKNIRIMGKSPTASKKKQILNSNNLFAEDNLLDIFYTNFEDRFRGDEETIEKLLEEYVPEFKKSKVDFEKTPVLDIGCGRGEFLKVMSKNNIRAEGIDINADMVDRVKEKGLAAKQGDAFEYIESVKPHSIGAVTGFHIVEHIPFATLLNLFSNIHSALAPGGFVIFETPNPENIIVGSCAFYTDPSHLHPIPPDLLAFAFEQCGFARIEIRRMHQVDYNKTENKNMPMEFLSRFYGPRDYAVIAFK